MTFPEAVICPETEVVTFGFTITSTEPMLIAAPRLPLKARPVPVARVATSLRIATDAAERTVPPNEVVTDPAAVVSVTTMPTPAPSPAENASPSACAFEKDWLRTVTAPPAVNCVPEPTVAATTGELITVTEPPAIPAASPIAPSVTRAKAGATVSVCPSPMTVAYVYVGEIGLPAASVFTRELIVILLPLSEPPPTVKARTVGCRSAFVLVTPAATPTRARPKPTASAIAVAVAAATKETSPEPAATTALSPRYDLRIGFERVVSLTIAASTASVIPAAVEVASGFEVRLAVTLTPEPVVVTVVGSPTFAARLPSAGPM